MARNVNCILSAPILIPVHAKLCMLSEYIYVFLTFYQNLVLVTEYYVVCWQKLRWRLLWRISGATKWSQK